MASTAKIGGSEILLADGALGPFVGAATDEVVHGTYRRTGTWAPDLLHLLCEDLLSAGGTLLDIGANIGLVSVPATERTGIRTLAFEPDPRNAELLRRNVALHGLEERVTVHETALFSRDGAMSLGRDASNHGDHRLLAATSTRGAPEPAASDAAPAPRANPSPETPVVATARLATLLDDTTLAALPRPVVAKIDTQGAEVDVLEGAGETLGLLSHAIVEIWPSGLAQMGRSLPQLRAILDAEFGWGRLLLDGEATWPLLPLAEIWERLATVPTLAEESTFFDLLVGRTPGPPGTPAD